MHELASVFKDSLCNEVLLTNLGREQNNPSIAELLLFTSYHEKMLNHSLSSLLHGCFLHSVLGFTLLRVGQRIKNTYGCQRATLLVGVSQKTAGCHFQCSTQVSGTKPKTIKKQPQQNTIMWWTAAVVQFITVLAVTFTVTLMLPPRGRPLSPGGGRAGLWREISGRVDLGWHCLCCTPQSIACHEEQRSMREVLAWVMHQAVTSLQHRAPCLLPLCLQSFPYPQKHETGALTDKKPCTTHRGGAPV